MLTRPAPRTFFSAPAVALGALEAGEGLYDVHGDRTLLAGVTMADVGDVAVQGAEIEPTLARVREAARRVASRSSTGSAA